MAWRLDNPKRLALEARDAKAATDLSGALPPAHTQKAENVIYNIKGMHRFNNIIADEVRDAQIPQETHSEAAPSEAPSIEPRMCLSVTNCHIDRMLAGLPLEIKVRMVQEYLDRIAE